MYLLYHEKMITLDSWYSLARCSSILPYERWGLDRCSFAWILYYKFICTVTFILCHLQIPSRDQRYLLLYHFQKGFVDGVDLAFLAIALNVLKLK